MKLPRIDSSILATASVSRALSGDIVKAQRRLDYGFEVVYRALRDEAIEAGRTQIGALPA